MTDQGMQPASGELLDAVHGLRERLAAATLPLDVEGVEGARASLTDTLDQLDDYVLPRLSDLDAPLLAVVGGSTGAGKSTLVNSIVGRSVSASSVIRPTTRACVLVHHPDDLHWFSGPRILPHLARVGGQDSTAAHDPDSVRLAEAPGLPAGVALLDAPDIDSVVAANRDLARQLLSAADLWLFVTTAARYADAVPWEFLRQAARRGTSVAIVLDRVPPGAADEIGEHLGEMLVDEGLRHAPVFVVSETELVGGLLPAEHTADLREWLGRLGADARARGLLVRRTLSGALESLEGRVEELAEASAVQVQTLEQLTAVVVSEFGRAGDEVTAGMSDGTLLRGEVLARWQEYVGTGEFLKQIEVGFGRLRDRVTAAVTGRPAPVSDLGAALHSGVAELVITHAERAQEQVRRRWRDIPGGRDLLVEHPELDGPDPDLDEDAARLVRDWQGDILDLVRDEGKDRRAAARVLSLGVNAVGVVLMLVAFSYTMGGLGGAEVGIAGGSAVLAQRLLEAIFGDQAVRRLAATARSRLAQRTQELYASRAARFEAAVEAVDVRRDQPAELLAASAAVRGSR
ncbi:dynamin family protein [Agilicoccus flavus]|uniref:dynamin family protein n=1 Tax=Agilicoccus flavus TaxID=2775968 RepID=UPI0027DA7D2B|nr:dynamin family protein [Agilicoccus flavus]